MSVTTPTTGQKISDFSAGNVDANSVFIQANNGNTTKVTATQIGEYSNLNLLFNGAGGLDTTNKTIVGAINEIDGKDASDISYDNTASGLTATDVQAAIDSIVKDLLKDYVKVKYVDVRCSSLTRGMNLSVNIDNGYKFLCWQSVGSSNGWITSFPVYIENCFSTTGGVYWNGTLPTEDNRSVRFWYYEIKNI